MYKRLFITILAIFLLGGWVYLIVESPSDGPVDHSTPTNTPNRSTAPSATELVSLEVPFTAQAPLGNWADLRQQDGCEEASALMAMHWVAGTLIGTAAQAEKEILAIADWEEKEYGSYHDTSAEDTAKRIFNNYFNYRNVRVEKGILVSDIIYELEQGNLVIVPADGQALGNPNFTPPGPERHMLVIIGYNPETQTFITNDPGTRRGKGYQYPQKTLFNAIRDYPTGDHIPITNIEKNMIVVSK